MVNKHKCKNPHEKVEKYLKDKSDPFEPMPNNKLEFYYEDIFEFNEYIDNLKNKMKIYISHKQEQFKLDPKMKVKTYHTKNEKYNDYYNITNGNDRNISKKRGQAFQTEYIQENDGIEIIRKVVPGKTNSKVPTNQKNKVDEEKIELFIDDYCSFFEQQLITLRSLIKKKINEKSIPENKVVVPKEIQFQMIAIISKLSDKQLSELVSITNFGISFETVNELLRVFSNKYNTSYEKVFGNLSFKQVLTIYKYLQISWLKVTDGFYKRDIDQIEQSLYSDFFPNGNKGSSAPKSEPATKTGVIHSFNIKPKSKYGLPQRENNKSKNDKSNAKENAQPKIEKTENPSKLKNFLENKPPVKVESKQQENDDTTNQENEQSKGKLGALLEGKIKPTAKKKKPFKQNFSLKNVDYDDEFPELD